MASVSVICPLREVDKTRKGPICLGLVILLVLAALVVPERGVRLPRLVMASVGMFATLSLLFLGFQRFQLFLICLVCYLPFSKVLPGDFGGVAKAVNATNILLGIALLGWAMRSASRPAPVHEWGKLDVLVVFFAFWAMLSFLVGGLSVGGWFLKLSVYNFKRWLTPLLLYFVFVNNMDTIRDIKHVVIIIMIATVIAGLMAIKQYHFDLADAMSFDKSRVTVLTDQPNNLGGFFSYYAPFLLAFGLQRFSLRNALLLGLFGCCCYATVLTFSRGALLSMFGAIFLVVAFRNKFLAFFLIVFACAAMACPTLIPSKVSERFESTVRPIDEMHSHEALEESQWDPSVGKRIDIWKGGIKMIRDHPLFGVGYDVFPRLIGEYAGAGLKGWDSHNGFLKITAEMGIPALLAWLVILILALKRAWKVTNSSANKFLRTASLGWLGGWAAVVVCNMFGSRLDSLEVSGYFWIMVALVTRMSDLSDDSQDMKSSDGAKTE